MAGSLYAGHGSEGRAIEEGRIDSQRWRTSSHARPAAVGRALARGWYGESQTGFVGRATPFGGTDLVNDH
jgi:hypothetical protein